MSPTRPRPGPQTGLRPVDRESTVPLWAQLDRDLRRRLDAGEFADSFPGELALVSAYGVSRNTVREALRRLRADGVVTAERGRAPRVADQPVIRQPLGALYSLFASVENQGVEQRSIVRAIDLRTDAAVATRLGVAPDTTLFYLERIRLAGGEPLALDRAWLLASVAGPLLEADFGHTSLYDELARRAGRRLDGGEEHLRAVVPSAEHQRLLELEPGTAAFAIDRVGRSGDETLEWRETLVRADRFSVTAQFSARSGYQLNIAPADPAAETGRAARPWTGSSTTPPRSGGTGGGTVPEPAWKIGKDERLLPYGDTNLGTPLGLVDGLIVPTELFFVRSNYPVPTVDPAGWRLAVHGMAERPMQLTLADLQAMPQRRVTAFLECAGDSRTRFEPQVDGTPWHDDAVGCAEWTGVPLRDVLGLAGMPAGVVDVVSQGADDPAMRRGLPLAAALDPDTLLVLQMNGEPLPVAHGAPLRLLVPGWAGIASTKWLVGLELVGERFDGYWNAERYVLVTPDGELAGRVQQMPVKSVVVWPAAGSTVPAGENTARGYAWSGCAAIDRVEVSADGGRTFDRAEITHRAGPRSWVQWAHTWVAEPGESCVLARAVDESGQRQPDVASWNAQGYQMNAVATSTFHVG